MKTLPLPYLMLLGIAGVLVSCGLPTTGVQVHIDIDPDLQSEIRVKAKDVKTDAAANPIEVSVTFENTGAQERRVLLEGKWQNNSGQGFGGMSDSRVIPAGSTTTFAANTRSERVTQLLVKVSETTLDSEGLAARTISQARPAVAGYGLSYTATPTLEQIPNWPPKGSANGAPFEAKTILFAPINNVWELQVIDREIDPLKGLAFARSSQGNAGLQSIHLQLPDEPSVGKVFDQKLSFGGGYFQIQTAPGSGKTTSWNTEIAWVLEITEWNRQPYVQTGGTFQKGGTVSGRLYICFKGSKDRIQDSFVSGVFKNAPVVYYGDPGRADTTAGVGR